MTTREEWQAGFNSGKHHNTEITGVFETTAKFLYMENEEKARTHAATNPYWAGYLAAITQLEVE